MEIKPPPLLTVGGVAPPGHREISTITTSIVVSAEAPPLGIATLRLVVFWVSPVVVLSKYVTCPVGAGGMGDTSSVVAI
jgi:hypothetical protein